LTDRFGKEILDLVADHTSDQIKDKLTKADLPQRDLGMVMKLLWDQMGDGFEFQVEQRSPQRLQIKVTHCFIADEMRRLNAADIGSAFYCAYDYGFCIGLNPHIKFNRTKTLMNGDDCCNHTYEWIQP
jgi:predicted ArsR family transcriptional regulator